MPGPDARPNSVSRALVVLASLLALSACQGRGPQETAPATAVEPAPALPEVPAVAPPLPIRNARTPLAGVLTGGQPTAEQLEAAARLGYRTVVNLRPGGEAGSLPSEADLVTRLGMRYIQIPVDHAAGLTEANARRLHQILEEPEARPMVIHCASGNRVGALLALRARLFEGAGVEEALERGRAAGLTRLEPATRERLEALQPANPGPGD